nr:5a [Avian coronavirus]
MKWLTSFGRAVVSCYKDLLSTQLRVLDSLILDYGPKRVLTGSRQVILFQLGLVYRLVFTPTQSLV